MEMFVIHYDKIPRKHPITNVLVAKHDAQERVFLPRINAIFKHDHSSTLHTLLTIHQRIQTQSGVINQLICLFYVKTNKSFFIKRQWLSRMADEQVDVRKSSCP
jgi:hypothetical protein